MQRPCPVGLLFSRLSAPLLPWLLLLLGQRARQEQRQCAAQQANQVDIDLNAGWKRCICTRRWEVRPPKRDRHGSTAEREGGMPAAQRGAA
jgi:hypothetical protein